MPEHLKSYHVPPSAQDLSRHLRNSPGVPPLDATKLQVVLLEGPERRGLQTPTTGDATLVITYKTREGAVTSVCLPNEDLKVLQLQGARQEGYRVNAGLRFAIMADQVEQIARHPESGIARVTMPPIIAIQGLVDATEGAMGRYRELATRLGMQFSDEEQLFVRDVK